MVWGGQTAGVVVRVGGGGRACKRVRSDTQHQRKRDKVRVRVSVEGAVGSGIRVLPWALWRLG